MPWLLQCRISIHAPREGSDQGLADSIPTIIEFLSTLPARGATQTFAGDPPVLKISIHAPREGSDLRPCYIGMGRRDFYPRSPRGERRV